MKPIVKKLLFVGIAGFVVLGVMAMLPMGKDQASALGYACGVNQGKYMAEEHRVWDDEGSQDKIAREKAHQNSVPAEYIDLFVQRYAEGFAAGQGQVKPEKHYLVRYRFDGHDGDEEEEVVKARSPEEATASLQRYMLVTESARGNNGRVSISVSKIRELTDEQYEERMK